MLLSSDDKILLALSSANSRSTIAVSDLSRRRLLRILPIFRASDSIASIAISPDGTRIAIGRANTGDLSVWDLRRGKPLLTLNAHKGGITSLAWTPDGTRLVSGSADNTVHVWDSRSQYKHEAELLLENLSDRCLLVEEVIRELEKDHTITAELRREANQLANQQGNAAYYRLSIEAWNVGRVSGRPRSEYAQALRRATVAVGVAPGWGFSQLALALLQYRVGEFDKALLSAQRGLEIQKSSAPYAHAIRAMASHMNHARDTAIAEIALARQAVDRSEPAEDLALIEEAGALVSGRK
jgi:hypothetical protein